MTTLMGHKRPIRAGTVSPESWDARIKLGENGNRKNMPCRKTRLRRPMASGVKSNELPSLSTSGADSAAPPSTGIVPMRAGTAMMAALTLPRNVASPETVFSRKPNSFIAVENNPMVRTAAASSKVVFSLKAVQMVDATTPGVIAEVNAIIAVAMSITLDIGIFLTDKYMISTNAARTPTYCIVVTPLVSIGPRNLE